MSGLFEGCGFLALQRFGRATYVTPDIVWASPLFNLIFFSALGLMLAGAGRLVPRLPVVPLSVFMSATLLFADWLGIVLFEYIHTSALAALAIGLAIQSTRHFLKNEARAIRFWRRSLPWVASTAVAALLLVRSGLWLQERIAIAQLPSAQAGAPNALVIVIDTLRADHLSSYGYARATSPHLDRIAEQGVLFEQAFSTSSYTLPSHASLITGRYTWEHHAEWNRPKALLDFPDITLPEALRGRGYRTGAFSANLFYFTRDYGFGRGFIRFEDYFHSLSDTIVRPAYGRLLGKVALPRLGYEDVPGRKRASDVNEALLRWIDRDRDKPFFAFLNYLDPHGPYLPPQPFRSRFSKSQNPGGLINDHIGRGDPKMTADELNGEIDAYDGAIAYVDHHIGELLAALEQRGLRDNTVIAITSDHGEAFTEHGMLLHDNSLYREVIHVPLIFWRPGAVPEGIRVRQPVSNASLPATLIDALGLGSEGSFPGPSLSSLWKSPESHADWPDPLAEMEHKPWTDEKFPVSRGSLKSLISPDWHYIETVSGTPSVELYDRKTDPHELRNLADSPHTQSVVARFKARTREILEHSRSAALGASHGSAFVAGR